MRAAIYARVSTAEQAEKGYSLETQLEAARLIAFDADASCIDEFVDNGYSGEFLDRPELDRLRGNLKSIKYGIVIVYDPDRLARNLSHQLIITEEIEKSGAILKFVSVSFEHSPEGKLFYSIRGAISDYEKEKIKERTMRGKRGKARQGKLTYNDKPLGYDFNKDAQMYTINEAEAKTISLIYELCSKRHLGTRSIARELNLLGHRTKNGKKFYMAAVLRILTNPMYKGSKLAFRYYDKQIAQHKKQRILRDPSEWVEIPVPAIVDINTWDLAQKVLQENRIFCKRNARREYLLSGFARCGICGQTLHGLNYTANGYEYRYYYCDSHATETPCDNRYIPLDKLDREVWEYLQACITERNELPAITGEKTADDALRDRLNAALSDLKNRQAAILKWVRDGTLDISAAEKDLQSLKKEIDLTCAALNSIDGSKLPQHIAPQDVLAAATYEQKRRLLREWGVKVYVKRAPQSPVIWAFGR